MYEAWVRLNRRCCRPRVAAGQPFCARRTATGGPTAPSSPPALWFRGGGLLGITCVQVPMRPGVALTRMAVSPRIPILARARGLHSFQ